MFDYKEAFRRNIGWVSLEEQNKISKAKIAVGGLGGVGGDEVIGLARMGFQHFNIADLDHFDLSNFNRQAGATVNTIGKSKVSVITEQLKAINPNIEINIFSDGITEDSVDAFLEGVDIYVDSLDLFAIHARSLVFDRAYKKQIPALTAAPLSMGTSFLCFMPGKMSFKEYFGFRWPNETELSSNQESSKDRLKLYLEYYGNNVIKFIAGLAPLALQRKYLVVPDAVNIFSKDVPSFKPGIDIASGVMCCNVLKVFLKRGEVLVAPRSLHFDSYLNTMKKVYRPFGAKNPLFALTNFIIKRVVGFDKKLVAVNTRLDESPKEVSGEISDKNLYQLISKI